MGHAKSRTKHTDVPALRVLDHDVQTVEAGAKGHGFLVHRVEVQRGLEERLRNIARDDVLKRLHDASADSSNASVEVEDRRVHALLAFEGKVAIPQLDGNGNQGGVGCRAQEVRTILEGELIGDDARRDFFCKLRKMQRSTLEPEETADVIELLCACGHSTQWHRAGGPI